MDVQEMDLQLTEMAKMVDALKAIEEGRARRLRLPVRLACLRVSKLAAATPQNLQLPPGMTAHQATPCEVLLETDKDVGDFVGALQAGEYRFQPQLALQVLLLCVRMIGYAPAPQHTDVEGVEGEAP